MPSWISKDGVFYPAKEKVALKNNSKEVITNPSTEGTGVGEKVEPGDPFIYEGPDRAALYELWLEDNGGGVVTKGKDFKTNPDFLQSIRNMGFDSVGKYLKFVGYDKVKIDENFEKKASVVNKHDLPHKVAAIDILGGGKDFAGQGKDKYGGFGSAEGVPQTG